MIPKTIHLCWFSNDTYPVEIRVCLDTWRRLLPDYRIRLWDYAAAKAIGCRFIDEALEERKWAFAADVVRFYAVWKEGGVYMDSDIFLFRRFDELLTDEGFVTFNERCFPEQTVFGLQAACFMGSAGNEFCRRMYEFYCQTPYRQADGTLFSTVSPFVMAGIAKEYGWREDDVEQHCGALTVYPTRLLIPRNHYAQCEGAIGQHRIYGSWRKRKFGRRVEVAMKHWYHVVRYALLRR